MPDRNAFKAGLFMVASVLLILAVIISIRGVDQLLDRKRDLVVMFELADDIGGLGIGDEVRIGGYQVGTVKQIDLVDAKPQPRLSVRVSIPAKYDIRRDALIRIQSTVTGVSMLNFHTLGTTEPLGDDEVLEGRAGTLTELTAALSEASPRIKPIMENLEKASGSIAQAAGDGSQLLIEARKQIDPEAEATIGHAARGMMAEIRDVIGDSKGDLRQTAANVAATTGDLKEKLPQMLEHVDQMVVRAGGMVESAATAMTDVQQTVASARDLSAGARDMVLGNRSKIEGMIDSLKKTGDNLKFASAEIRRSPWRLLYKPGKGEMGNLNLFDSARAFAEGAGELADATEALRDAVKTKQVDEARLKELLGEVEGSFKKFNTVEEKLWEEVRE